MQTLTVELTVGDRSIEAEYTYFPGQRPEMHIEVGDDESLGEISTERPFRVILDDAVWDTGEDLDATELTLYQPQLDRLAQSEAQRRER
jgi:hypothetical protein